MHIILEYTISMKQEETIDLVDTASSCKDWIM